MHHRAASFSQSHELNCRLYCNHPTLTAEHGHASTCSHIALNITPPSPGGRGQRPQLSVTAELRLRSPGSPSQRPRYLSKETSSSPYTRNQDIKAAHLQAAPAGRSRPALPTLHIPQSRVPTCAVVLQASGHLLDGRLVPRRAAGPGWAAG